MSLEELVENSPSIEVLNSWLVTNSKIESCNKALCAISGGSDSDILLHLCATLDKDNKVNYVFFDTGLEFQATKDHLKRLEEKYGVKIETIKAGKTVPFCCRKYGQPFLSKRVSELISRLQRHNFKWEDKTFDELIKEYPKCKSALMWWCNVHEKKSNGKESNFNIAYNKWLKEFIIENPPDFPISNKCCYYAKKLPAKQAVTNGEYDLHISGVRKAEGGARATAYKNCFTPATEKNIDQYRPIFWYTQETKRQFEERYGIKHSACYEVWGLSRTGCSGCPYGKNFEFEVEAVKKYEPKLYKALENVFGKSYEYTRKYRIFREARESNDAS